MISKKEDSSDRMFRTLFRPEFIGHPAVDDESWFHPFIQSSTLHPRQVCNVCKVFGLWKLPGVNPGGDANSSHEGPVTKNISHSLHPATTSCSMTQKNFLPFFFLRCSFSHPLLSQKRHHQQQLVEPDSGAEVSIRLVVQRGPEPLRHLWRPSVTDYRHWEPDRLPALPHLPTPLACSGNRLVSSDTRLGNPRQATLSVALQMSHLSHTMG